MHSEGLNLASEVERLRRELERSRAREQDLEETRRAVLNLLEDLEEDRRTIQRAEREWRAAFDHIRDPMFMHDDRFRLIRANRAYLGYAEPGLAGPIGLPYWEVFPRIGGALPGCPEGEPRETEFVTHGQTFRSRAYRVDDAEGRFAFAIHIMENITERRNAETEIRRRSDDLYRANLALEKALADLKAAELAAVQTEKLSAVGVLASGVAHELNNPLMGIMAYLDYANHKCADPKVKEMLVKADRELKRMRDIIRNMLTFARPAETEAVPVPLAEVLHAAHQLLQADFRRDRIELTLSLPEDLPPVLATYAGLQQVLMNLLINARDALALAAEKRITVRAERSDDRVRIEVADTGPGISPENLNRIFDPFFTTKPPGSGTGLGLAISRNIVTAFGGSLEYRSGGVGATFEIALRIAPQGGAEAGSAG